MAAILLNSRIITVALLLAARPAAAQPATAPTDAVSELKQMQQRLLETILAGQRAAYAAMLADDWRVTHVDGRVLTKAQVLEQVFGAPEPPLKAGKIDDVEVRVYGDAAVVTGQSSWTGNDGKTSALRFTDTAVRRDGRWVIVASHATALR